MEQNDRLLVVHGLSYFAETVARKEVALRKEDEDLRALLHILRRTQIGLFSPCPPFPLSSAQTCPLAPLSFSPSLFLSLSLVEFLVFL
eukprot:6214500-Pleurochrysis_carterae.AAC.8